LGQKGYNRRQTYTHKMRLTDDVLRKAKGPEAGQQFPWDALVTGFGVRLTPTRTSFVVQWRASRGTWPRESLKRRWPATTVIAARDLARFRLAETTATLRACHRQTRW